MKSNSMVKPAQNGNVEDSKIEIVRVTFRITEFNQLHCIDYYKLTDENMDFLLKIAYYQAAKSDESWFEFPFYYDGVIVNICSDERAIWVSCDGGMFGEGYVSDVESLIETIKGYAAAVRKAKDKYEIIKVEELQ